MTLRALLVSDNGKTFQSRAFYIVDKLGCVLVKSEPSVGGDCTGIEPMGLMWAMSPATGQLGQLVQLQGCTQIMPH